MKILTLIRHAKSEWNEKGLEDFERGISERGEKQIKEMGKILKKLDFNCDLIICSSSRRTVLTLKGLSKYYKEIEKIETKYLKEVYDLHKGRTDEFIELIEKQEEKIGHISLVGHNSLFDELIEKLTNTNGLHVPTLGIVKIIFEIKYWKEIRKNGIIKMLICPEN